MIDYPKSPIMCSQGGFTYNGEHIDYWKNRAKDAASEVAKLKKQLEDAEATIFKLNSGEELQSLMKLNNELVAQIASLKLALTEGAAHS